MKVNFKKLIRLPNYNLLSVNEANSTFETKKKAYVDGQIERIRDLTSTLNGVLRTMHLPEAIEETSGSGVPRSVADKALDVRVKGGIDKIKSLCSFFSDKNQKMISRRYFFLSKWRSCIPLSLVYTNPYFCNYTC